MHLNCKEYNYGPWFSIKKTNAHISILYMSVSFPFIVLRRIHDFHFTFTLRIYWLNSWNTIKTKPVWKKRSFKKALAIIVISSMFVLEASIFWHYPCFHAMLATGPVLLNIYVWLGRFALGDYLPTSVRKWKEPKSLVVFHMVS